MSRRRNADPRVHSIEAHEALAAARKDLDEAKTSTGEAAHLALLRAAISYGALITESRYSPHESGQESALDQEQRQMGHEIATLAAARGVPVVAGGEPSLGWASGWSWPAIESAIFKWAVERYGSEREAAKALGIPRSTLKTRIQRVERAMQGGPYASRGKGVTPAENPGAGFLDDWDRKPFRAHDAEVDDEFVWYGPEGAAGDVATAVEVTRDGFVVSEYQNVEGLLDDPPGPIMQTSTYLSRADLAHAVRTRCEIDEADTSEDSYLLRLVMNDDADDDEWARLAAAVGAAKLAYFGGETAFHSGIPGADLDEECL